MLIHRPPHRFCLVAPLLALALVAAPALAQTAADQTRPSDPNTGAISVSLGVDFVTQYWFRGLAQENQGLIAQPSLGVGISVLEADDVTLTLHAGIWNSLHEGPTGSAGSNSWYEADASFGATLGLANGLGFDASYIILYNPNGSGIFAEEIDLTVSYDDSELLGDFALSPYVTVAFETDGGSDAGNDLGTYLELGIEPEVALLEREAGTISLSFPMKAGFSLENYYEDPTGDDDTFGYADVGAHLNIPLTGETHRMGAWSATVGIHGIYLGDSSDKIAGPGGFGVTSGDNFEIWGLLGIAMEY